MEHATQLPGQNRCRPRETPVRERSSGGRLALHAMAVEFPQVHGHPNRLPFEGVLTLVDVASDKAPSGARGHRVVLTREAAQAALPSLLGMAVDYKSPPPAARPGDPACGGWDGHDARQKCGIITDAERRQQASRRRLRLLQGLPRDRAAPPRRRLTLRRRHGHELRASQRPRRRHAGPDLDPHPGHLHRRRHPPPRQSRLPRHDLRAPPRTGDALCKTGRNPHRIGQDGLDRRNTRT
jgi:hypothetical protein